MKLDKGYYLLIFTVILNIVAVVVLAITHKNLKECNNSPSFKCPVFSCPDGSMPIRCIQPDAGKSTCSGDNVMTMNYDVTAPLTYTSSN